VSIAYNIMLVAVIVSIVLVMVVFPLVTYLWYKAGKLSIVTFVAVGPFMILLPASALAGLMYVATPDLLSSAVRLVVLTAFYATAASIGGVLIVKHHISRGRLK
jgi:hypothetical protein